MYFVYDNKQYNMILNVVLYINCKEIYLLNPSY